MLMPCMLQKDQIVGIFLHWRLQQVKIACLMKILALDIVKRYNYIHKATLER